MKLKYMLIDAAQPEITRLAVVKNDRLESLDYELKNHKQLKGNIYFAKVVRVEPALQAVFVDYGGTRNGFLELSDIHPDYYQILKPPKQKEYTPGRAHPLSQRSRTPILLSDISTPTQKGQNISSDLSVQNPSSIPHADLSLTENIIDVFSKDSKDSETSEDSKRSESESLQEPSTVSFYPLDSSSELSDSPETQDDIMSKISTPSDLTEDSSDFSNTNLFYDPDSASEESETTFLDDPLLTDVYEDSVPVEQKVTSNYHYNIQEVISQNQTLLVQVIKEEHGQKGATLTTYISLPGRYCVLLPKTLRRYNHRKLSNTNPLSWQGKILNHLDISPDLSVIIRTAGRHKSAREIKRDFEYLLGFWNDICTNTANATTPCLIHEEANLIKRALRDYYTNDIKQILVDGEQGYQTARDFMQKLFPQHIEKVRLYRDPQRPIFHSIEQQIEDLYISSVSLKSGGSIVINKTEALVAIDVNSGRATLGRHIEETAIKTNLEAAKEIARQIRLRDLGGLIVIDFIDMGNHSHIEEVQRKLKEAMKSDRARSQIDSISRFGLLALTRQRLRTSLQEYNFRQCNYCSGTGYLRTSESLSLYILSLLRREGLKANGLLCLSLATQETLYILNYKRNELKQIEEQYGLKILVRIDHDLAPRDFRLERLRVDPIEDINSPILKESLLFEKRSTVTSEVQKEYGAEKNAKNNKPKRSIYKKGRVIKKKYPPQENEDSLVRDKSPEDHGTLEEVKLPPLQEEVKPPPLQEVSSHPSPSSLSEPTPSRNRRRRTERNAQNNKNISQTQGSDERVTALLDPPSKTSLQASLSAYDALKVLSMTQKIEPFQKKVSLISGSLIHLMKPKSRYQKEKNSPSSKILSPPPYDTAPPILNPFTFLSFENTFIPTKTKASLSLISSKEKQTKTPKEKTKKEKPVKKLVGAIVYHMDEEKGVNFALVNDKFGKWTLSKGSLEPEEDMTAGVQRVIKDELGILVEVKEQIGNNSYTTTFSEKSLRKEITYFLAKTQDTSLSLKSSGDLVEVRWFRLEDILGLPMYKDLRNLILNTVKRMEEEYAGLKRTSFKQSKISSGDHKDDGHPIDRDEHNHIFSPSEDSPNNKYWFRSILQRFRKSAE